MIVTVNDLRQVVRPEDVDRWIRGEHPNDDRVYEIWEKFKNTLQDGDQLWSWAAGGDQGYAIKRGDKVFKHLRTNQR